MLNKKLFSIATSLFFLSSFGLAEEVIESEGEIFTKNKTIKNNNKENSDIRVNLIDGRAENNAAIAVIDTNKQAGKTSKLELTNLIVNVENGEYNGEFRGIRLWSRAESLLSNSTININGTEFNNKVELIRIQEDLNNGSLSESRIVDGLKAILNDVKANFTGKVGNPYGPESAIYGVNAHSEEGDILVKNIEFELNKGTITGNVTGAMAGKYDEVNNAKTTTGKVDIQNTVLNINDSIINGAVKGAEGDSGKSNSKVEAIVNLTNSEIDKGVIGAYAGNFKYSITGPSEEEIYNLRDLYKSVNSYSNSATAYGSVNLNNSTVKNYLYGSAALNQKEAYSESSVSLSNNSIITKDAYGSYAVSKNENATSLGALSLALNSKIEGDAYGAYLSSAKDAKAGANINIEKSEILGNLYGTYIDNVDEKTINVEASSNFLLDQASINGKIAGNTMGNVKGDVNAEGQFTLKDSSKLKGDIYGNQIGNVGGEVKNASALLSLENSKAQANLYGNSIGNIGKDAKLSVDIFLTSSEVAGDIYGNIIGDIAGNLKAENQLIIDSSEVGGNIYVNKIQSANDVDIKTLLQISNENAKEIKGDIYANYFEKISGNIDNAELNIILDNAKVTSNIYGNYIKEFGNEDEEAKVVSNITLKNNAHLEKDLTANYFGKVNGHINSEANIILDNANINGHIYGNFLDNFDENDQKGGNAVLKSELTLTNNVNIVGDIYGNYVKDAKGDVKAESIITLNEANGKDEGTIYGNYIENAKNVDVSSEIIVKEGKDKDIDSHIYGNYIKNASGDIKTDNFIHLEGDGFHGEIIGTYVEGSKDANLDLNNIFNIVNDTAKSNIEFGTIAGHRVIGSDGIMAYNNNFTKAAQNAKNTLVLNNTQITVKTLENINDFVINLGGDRDLNGLFYSSGEYGDKAHEAVITVLDNIVYDNEVLGNAQAIIGGFNKDQVHPGYVLDVLNVDGKILQNGKEITMAELFTNQENGQIDIGFIETGYTNWIVDPETGQLSVVITSDPSKRPQEVDYCEFFPNSPKCKTEPPEFCELPENANDPQCRPIEPPVDCKLNPNHPACAFQVSQERLAKASSIYQARLASMATINKGADLVVNTITLNLEPTKLGDLIPFASVEAGRSKYKSGGSFKNTSYNLIAGYGYSFDESVIGWFFEYGRGKYNATNNFSNGKVKGNGKAHYQGVGMLGKTYFGNFYLDGSIHSGINKVNYNTDDVKSGAGDSANFSNRQTYIATHAGAGYKAKVEAATFDTSLKVLYATTGKDKEKIAGTDFKFDRVNSTRLRVAEDFSHDITKNVAIKAGAAYEYEFAAKAKGKIGKSEVIAPKLKGSTYEGSLGLALHPFNGGDKNKVIELSGKGYLGKQKGGSGNIQFTYNF